MSFIEAIKFRNAQAEKYLQQERLYQYGKALEQARSLFPKCGDAELAEKTMELLADDLLSEKQKQLLNLFSYSALTQEELDHFLSDWDIEVTHSDEALLLSCVQKEHPELDFGAYNGPRLSGLYDFYKFRSMDFLYHFSRLLKALNEAAISQAVPNSGALFSAYPALYGMTCKLELCIADAQYATVEKIVSGLGYSCKKTGELLTIPVKGKTTEGQIIVQSFSAFARNTGVDWAADTADRAVEQELFHAKALLPCAEDQLCFYLSHIAATIRNNCNRQELLLAIAELVYLLRHEKDWDENLLTERILQSKTTAECILGAYFVNHIVPGLIPDKVICGAKYEAAVNQMIDSDSRYIHRAFRTPLTRQSTVIIHRLAFNLKHILFERFLS